ncbi:MAG: translocation protein TolB [Bacteroidetes bacterium]|nr:translocation protein TolB [Bacteroidota bacterium]
MVRFFLFSLIWFCSASAVAQQMLDTFGKNRIQYKNFKWTFLSSENFDVYYYDDRRKVATDVTEFLEGEFGRITDLIGYPPYLKTKIFLYNSVADLQQSNIGLNRNPYIMGGETDFVKPYVEIAHTGTIEGFKEELLLKVTELLVNEMMFGGSLKDMFQNAVLLNLPEWFTRGVAEYAAKGWNEEMDDFSRQLVRSRKVNRALNLQGKEAAMVGHSIWNFIAEKYGKGSVSNILNYSRVIRNEQRSVLITLGITFRQLMTEWKNFYNSGNKVVDENYQEVAETGRFTPVHRSTTVFPTMRLSPDGKQLAFAENDRGKYTVKVVNLQSGNESTILTGGYKVLRQTVDFREPLINWADEKTLGVIGKDKGEFIFWLYDLQTRSKVPRRLEKFNNIRSFDFSSNGRLAVLSGDQDGQNDLYLISSRRDRARRLTNDLFDDLDPSFVPGTNSVVFSSNRTTDTVNTRIKGLKNVPTVNYNLFLYNLDSTNNIVYRLTNTLSKDFHPVAINENIFYYLSDQRGITNIFRFDRLTSIYSQVTNFSSGVKTFDFNLSTNRMAMVTSRRLSEDIFLLNDFDMQRQIFTPSTRRKEVQQAKMITEKRQRQPVKSNLTLRELMDQRLKELDGDSLKKPTPPKPDSVKIQAQPQDSVKQKVSDEIDTSDYTFEKEVKEEKPKAEERPSVLIPPALLDSAKVAAPNQVNTSDYVFEDEVVAGPKPTDTFLSRYLKANASAKILGPFSYHPRFSYENLVTNFVIDQLRGFSVKMETQMNDMLENYRIYGGIQTAFDAKSGDVFAEFQYLPRLIDFSARFDRKVIFWERPESNIQEKYSFQKIEFGASLPLFVRLRASLKPFAGFTRFLDRGDRSPTGAGGPVFREGEQQLYAGAKAELVFDNSIATGLNIIEGTRGKMMFTNYSAPGNVDASFSQFSLDVRHYQKIYREIVFAVRGFAGTFFGNAPKNYLLGGMENWVSNRTNYDGLNNPLYTTANYNTNLLFAEFVNLRGFDYATLYGNSAAIANAELRVPLIRALSGGPIASNFFRNMQLTAFYDIGSSWNGGPPFNSTSSVRSRIVPSSTTGSPFVVKINEYLNPWLYSYGFGFRSMMLGYYLKFDLAWPVENYTVKNPRLHITLGLDF